MHKILRTLLVSTLLLGSSFAHAAGTSPLGFSIVPPVQFPPSDFVVAGLRINALVGAHRRVYGLDLGVVGNIVDQHFTGIQAAGGFNYNKGTSTIIGLQAAGLANFNVDKSRIYGLQAALGYNYLGAESHMVGIQAAVIGNNCPFTHVVGAQIGLYNRADTVTGFQIGLINDTQNLHGIQIGLVNFNRRGLFWVAPILNVGF